MVRTLTKIPLLTICLLALLTACTTKTSPPELRIFVWSEYFDDEFLRTFEKKTASKVKADYFSSNEEMLAKLQLLAGGNSPGYDLILPSDYMIRTLIELKMLRAIDKAKLPFLADFEKEAVNPEYDPGLQFSVPLAIGTTGIAVNTKLLPQFAEASAWNAGLSWKEVLENPAYRGKVTLLDDTKEVLQIVLLLQGKQVNTASEADVKSAFAYLKAHKEQLKGFPPETRPVIEADECALCMVYSGDALSVSKDKKEIRFILPKEGASTWTDNFALPTNGQNVELAYQFINEVLGTEGAKSFTLRTGYRTANLKARELLPAEVKDNRTIFPSKEDRARLHFLLNRKDLGRVIDREWALLKSQ